jgi:hypothetical protein
LTIDKNALVKVSINIKHFFKCERMTFFLFKNNDILNGRGKKKIDLLLEEHQEERLFHK